MSELTESTRSSSNESLQNEEPNSEVKFTMNIVLNNFFTTKNKELEFPSSLSPNERAYVRKLCDLNDLIFETRGKGFKKYAFVSKKSSKKSASEPLKIEFNTKMSELIKNNPLLRLSEQEIEILTPKIQKPSTNSLLDRYKNHFKCDLIQPAIPNYTFSTKKFPICNYKEQIMNFFGTNRLLFIGGDSAIGKSNQIGEYILEFYDSIKQKCRVIFSLPFDLLAYSIALNISRQRGENLGSTVGCHVYTNKKYSNKNTLLTFCTHEILLKNITSDGESSFFNSVTDIVLDEINFRDRYLDFILILIREIIYKYNHLRVILVGPSQMKEQIQKYFIQCSIYIIPSIHKGNVKEVYLNEVLKMINYSPGVEAKKHWVSLLERMCAEKRKKVFFKNNSTKNSLNSIKNMDVDFLIEQSFKDGTFIEELEEMVKRGQINVNYQQKDFWITILISAVVNGRIDVVESLLRLGANQNLRSCNQMNAIDWAKRFSQVEILNLLENYQSASYFGSIDGFNLGNEIDDSKQTYDLSLIKSFYQKLSENFDNLIDLIVKLINKILGSENEGSIMIYLSNYSQLSRLKKILRSKKAIKLKIYQIFEDISFEEYENMVQDKSQKIILTTKISEFLPLAENVTVLIDTGLNQEIVHEERTNSRSKKSQRAKNFSNQNTCEFLSYPLQEICLLSKHSIAFNTSITDFICKALDYPAFLQLRNSINCLKLVDALDTWEDMSDLGVHLINLPIDLQYSKSIIYAILLKCLEPVLVVVSALSVGEPFVDLDSNQRKYFNELKKTLVNDCKSDHILLYKIFIMWKKALKEKNQKKFCSKFYLNELVLNEIEFQRIKLLKHLLNSGLIKSSANTKELNINSTNVNCIKACLVAGWYPNVLRYDNSGFVNSKDGSVRLNSMSSLWSYDIPDANWAFHDSERCISGNVQIVQRISLVSSSLIAFFAGPTRSNPTNSKTIFKIDNFISFRMSQDDLDGIDLLRKKFNSVFLNFIKKMDLNDEDEKVIALVVEFIDSEEKNILDLNNDNEIFDFIFENSENQNITKTFYLDEMIGLE
ncbi:putative ATP-dependent RNA helicase YTHDC2 [Brachionus plicatilis]|uniref:Putative ATP-dependent RNA helicase YTHDC2 n=1 Tax=Brachionus plicatilis TaxID=10195 RepID=A0A3M7Q9H8_BRAPC|nr:putative ATP-dependent RNA helicase YTHDC2 [Brachionus plicatilis]